MIIKSDKVFYKNKFIKANIEIKDGKIITLSARGEADKDLSGKYVLPGFIDIHTHGSVGFDTMDASVNGLVTMKKYMAENGVTSFLPTTMTMGYDHIKDAIISAKKASEINEGAQIAGVYLEGPYFCEKRKGGQNIKYLRNPDVSETEEWIKTGEGLVKVMSIAPELENSLEFISKMADKITLAMGHTDATYDEAKKAVEKGIAHATHLFNAMSAFTHREPGVVGAVLDLPVTSEIICDGIHIHPAAIRMAIKAKGAQNLAVISDSMRAAGMPDGEYDLGGQDITVLGGRALTKGGNLAGSTTNMLCEFKNLIEWGIPIEDVARMTSENPARIVKLHGKGKIQEGYDADFTVLDENFNLVHTIIGGKIV